VLVAEVSGNFDQDTVEEQFIAYRTRSSTGDSPISVALLDYRENAGAGRLVGAGTAGGSSARRFPYSQGGLAGAGDSGDGDGGNSGGVYERVWSAVTSAVRPETVSLYTLDLVGDRSVCALLFGMNSEGKHTLTAFRFAPVSSYPPQVTKIADISIDGVITVQETPRTSAYQQGIAPGESFIITASSRDTESANLLDQVETTYGYNPDSRRYEERSTAKIPGAQVEQRLVRGLLSGGDAFKRFISGLWYYISPAGTLDFKQYLYFDLPGEQITLFNNGSQQVFSLQNAISTSRGLYLTAHNIQVTGMRLSMDIELESLDSIRVGVREEVRMKLEGGAPWNGSYRRVPDTVRSGKHSVAAPVNAVYGSALGTLRLLSSGDYELDTGGRTTGGKYAFFHTTGEEGSGGIVNTGEFLELGGAGEGGESKIYLITRKTQAEAETLTLQPVRLTLKGFRPLPGRPFLMTLQPGASPSAAPAAKE